MIVSAFLLAETEVVKDVMAEVELTEKQKRLVDYFIETGNQTEAAIKAGYSKKNARFIASKTLDLPYVKAFLEKRLKKNRGEPHCQGERSDGVPDVFHARRNQRGGRCRGRDWRRLQRSKNHRKADRSQ